MTYAAAVARASREAQGLPARLTDPVLLRSLAVHFSAPAISVDARRLPPKNAQRASAEAGGAELVQLGPQPECVSSTSTHAERAVEL